MRTDISSFLLSPKPVTSPTNVIANLHAMKLITTRLCLFLALVLSFSAAFAQTGSLKRAQRSMEDLSYSEAIQQYTQILAKSDDPVAKIKLAEAYRKTNDAVNAEYWYGQVVRLPESTSFDKLYYGQALQRNGKCDQAKEWFALFIQEQPDDLRGQYLSRACDYEQELRTKAISTYEVQHLDFNSALDDFGAATYQNGLLFASDRSQGVAVKRDHAWTGNPFLELYYVETRQPDKEDPLSTVYGRPDKFSKNFNSKYHDAAVTFTEDSKTMFFTRNNFKDGKIGKSDDGIIKLKVFYADKNGEDGWGELQSLPFNSDEYSVLHPALSKSGDRLYFASDMPGGFGGMDVYYSEKDNGRWGPPINLGPVVNTEGHEAFPFAAADGRIYFSSDGHIGLGGYDIFYTTEKGPADFSQPENLGAPMNSISDDHSIMVKEDGNFGYFSSNRTGGAGLDDIYSFTRSGVPVEVLVIDADTRLPIEGATVLNACTAGTTVTDVNGIALADMGEDEECVFTASAERYEDADKKASTFNFRDSKLVVEIPLKPLKEYSIEGFVYDESTGDPIEGARVTLTSSCSEEAEEVFTDAAGRYEFELESGCCHTVRGVIESYLSDKEENICTTDTSTTRSFTSNLFLQPTVYGTSNSDLANTDPNSNGGNPMGEGVAGTTTRPDQDPNARIYQDPSTGIWIDSQTGRPADGNVLGRTYKDGQLIDGDGKFIKGISPVAVGDAIPYLLHIYYDFNKATIRKEARPELESLYTMMVDNPQVIIEIASHTDARGTDDYNLRLSQRRAESVVRYLVQRGIERDRMVPRGYGETLPVNACNNGVPCSEREHQFNRRTEFRVLGCTDCDAKGKSSLPKKDVEVSPCKNCPF